jgi:hypothetical protein
MHGKIYLVWDNSSVHRRALNLWRPRPTTWNSYGLPQHFLAEPDRALVLGPEKTALHNTDLKKIEAIAEHLIQGIDYLNGHPRPYQWRKAV